MKNVLAKKQLIRRLYNKHIDASESCQLENISTIVLESWEDGTELLDPHRLHIHCKETTEDVIIVSPLEMDAYIQSITEEEISEFDLYGINNYKDYEQTYANVFCKNYVDFLALSTLFNGPEGTFYIATNEGIQQYYAEDSEEVSE